VAERDRSGITARIDRTNHVPVPINVTAPLNRTPVAVPEVRVRLPPRLGNRLAGHGWCRAVGIAFYNHQRPHAAHGGQPPAVVYFNAIETDQQARRVA
jgi:hypothetical protein